MKILKPSLCAVLIILAHWANGQNISGVINAYTPVNNISGCSNHVLKVGTTQGFSPNDKVLLIQMQGATIDQSNNANFGNIVGVNSAGLYEFNRIKSVSNGQIELLNKTIGNFEVGGKVQLVKVPEYTNATVSNVLTCQPWNGTTGGILVLDVSGTLTLNNDILVSGNGFRGGAVVDASAAPYGEVQYFYAPDPIVSGQKGEGVAIIPIDKSYGRGKAANGGGAGNSHNGGGGGGGNSGAGGFGGLEYFNTPSGSPTPGTNGVGGLKLYEQNNQRLLLGGGGGAGHTNDNHGTSGGNGGGIVILITNNLVTNGNQIFANGMNVVAGGTERNDGQGGGGAGGTIFLQANQITGNLDCQLSGGFGGDCLFFVQSQIIGPGGGGGGGKFLSNLNFPNVTANISGGQNGVANQNNPNGATPGEEGLKMFGAALVASTNPAQIEMNFEASLCPGETLTLGGQTFTAPATVTLSIPGQNGACDTLTTYNLTLKPQVSTSAFISLCPGETITLGGQSYTAPATVNLTLPGQNGACDTLATYTLIQKPLLSVTGNIQLCPGQTISLGGQTYTAPATANFTLQGMNGDCDTMALFTLTLKPQEAFSQNILLCPGETVTLGGQAYTAPATINLTFPGVNDECDTLATYELILKPQISITENIPLCPGETVSLGGQNYTAPASVDLVLPGLGDACDTLATYILRLLPQVSVTRNLALCPGETVSLGGQTYTAPATVNLTLAGLGDECDTLATYVLGLLPQPTVSRTIQFCPGETVTLGGINYTQPTTVILELPAITGCDTVATYSLEYLTPAPSNVGIVCPNHISLATPPGTGPIVVNYATPVAATDCPCPGLELNLSAGLPSGSLFPVTNTTVCWTATDSCGQSASCCFVVTVREEEPCDVKFSGCVKYELLTITEDAGKNTTYRVRVTNNCPNKLIYTAIQVPDGMIAMYPDNNATYVAPSSGRTYEVRNPNFSPMYSVRFKSDSDSIANGESEIFRYKLPAQADVTFIDIVSRLEPQIFLEAHLNTFYCPVGVTPAGERPGGERQLEQPAPPATNLLVFPNPTSGTLYLDVADWDGQWLNIRLLDANGSQVLAKRAWATGELLQWNLPEGISSGLYFLEVQMPDGSKVVEKVGVLR